MPDIYTVKKAKFKKNWTSNKGLEWASFTCYFEEIPEEVEVSLPANEPQITMGNVLIGELQDGKFGKQLYGSKRIEKTRQEDIDLPSFLTEQRQPIDDRQRSIVRQHSAEMALRWTAQAWPKERWEGESLDALKEIIDWFVADAFGENQPEKPQSPPNGSITPDQALSLAEQAKAAGMKENVLRLAMKSLGVELKDGIEDDPYKALTRLTPAQANEFTAEYLS